MRREGVAEPAHDGVGRRGFEVRQAHLDGLWESLGEVGAVLRRLAASMPRHRCVDCGFTSRGHFWQCPACKTWDSQRPVLRFEFGVGHETAARGA